MNSENSWHARYEREREARERAESTLEERNRQLADARQELQEITETLEIRIDSRTRALTRARDQALAAQQELEELSIVASRIDASVIIADRNGITTWVNDGFTRLTGYTSDEVIGKKPGAVLQGPETDPKSVARLRDGLTRKEPFRQEIINYRKTGEPYWVSVYITPVLDEDREVVKYIAVEADISARKEAEDALRRAKEAAEMANQVKSEFLANMSHEVRTPMNGIMGMSELLLGTSLNHEQRDYTETIKQSAGTLLAIINDILDFSKIEAGKLTIEPIPFDLRIAVEEVATMLADKAERKGVELIVHFDQSLPTRFVGDAGRIRQVLTNLAGNAVKFTHRGSVTVHVAANGEIAECVPLRITVEDTGIGIPPAKLQSIFAKFTQADTSTSRKYGGTGLGLAISQQLVELMGGAIEVESQLGEGSRFSFSLKLPLAQESAPRPVPVAALEGARILVVDDHATNRRVLCEQLGSWGTENNACDSGEDALDALHLAEASGRPYDMAIIDHQMPEMDGETLGRLIRTERKFDRTLLVMLSSVGQRGDAKRFSEIGFNAYLTKPIRLVHLTETLALIWAARESGEPIKLITRHTVAESHSLDSDARDDGSTGRALSVLLVDDNLVNQKVAVAMLRKLGCHVNTAANGQEAVEACAETVFDLVFMDCQMPILDGLEATTLIRRAEKPGAHVPIIAMTANAMKGDREACLDAGMDDYLAKPVDQDTLSATIERWSKPAVSIIGERVDP